MFLHFPAPLFHANKYVAVLVCWHNKIFIASTQPRFWKQGDIALGISSDMYQFISGSQCLGSRNQGRLKKRRLRTTRSSISSVQNCLQTKLSVLPAAGPTGVLWSELRAGPSPSPRSCTHSSTLSCLSARLNFGRFKVRLQPFWQTFFFHSRYIPVFNAKKLTFTQ